jgi:hypothetical protein
MCVHDLHLVWEREQSKRRTFVSREEAWIKYEANLPFPPPLIWEYLTAPTLEAGFLGYDFAERSDQLGGRVREDAQFHCAHGNLDIDNKVLDWKPFEYYTVLQAVRNSVQYMHTRRLIPINGGSRLCVYASEPTEGASEDLRQYIQAEYNRGFGNLETFIKQDIESGKVTVG